MKKTTMHEKEERYRILSCIGGLVACPHCKKEFDFALTDFAGLHLTAGLYYYCPHCKHILTLDINIIDGVREKTLKKGD